MTTLRFIASISYFALVVSMLPQLCGAEDPIIRKAATPSAAEVRGSYPPVSPGNGKLSSAKNPMGLSPVPYSPERSADGYDQGSRRESTAVRSGQYPDIRGLIRKVNQSVVAIRMVDGTGSWSIGGLGSSGETGTKAMGYGSGFIVSSHGHIITNEHVLRSGSQIEVELLGGRKHLAKVLSKDSRNDIALLKINATDLAPVAFGNSDGVELGEWVVGIGNPYGIGQSIMIGIVSAQQRMIPGSGYPPLIQIDAAMNLGNSGGPLFNMDGEVIGINTILLWKSQGIGFATPINIARSFLERRNGNRRADASDTGGALGPASDAPRELPVPIAQSFNPLDPPWKSKQR